MQSLPVSISRNFPSSQTIPEPIKLSPHSPLPHFWQCVFYSINLPILGTSCKWNHKIFAFMSGLFPLDNIFKVPPCCCILEPRSFLRLNNAPWYVYTTSHWEHLRFCFPAPVFSLAQINYYEIFPPKNNFSPIHLLMGTWVGFTF